MTYPSLLQYLEALQNPKLCLIDPQLKNANIQTTGLGLPLALCGGFALTFPLTINGKKYALRCFHKRSDFLDVRYKAIHNKLTSLQSGYFVGFDFQPKGIRIDGQLFPIVKMEWASGQTLGEFLESNWNRKLALKNLILSLGSLAAFFEGKHIAHGDIQPGNLMVDNNGLKIQLIDYDGMFVEEIRSHGSAEKGQRNFQHPERKTQFDSSLDRFSFISLSLALRLLTEHPKLWKTTSSDPETVVFNSSDFLDPQNSDTFKFMLSQPNFALNAKHFMAICLAPFNKIPTLADFLTGRNIPKVTSSISIQAVPAQKRYLSTYTVVAADKFQECLSLVGEKVELIGRIVEVKNAITRNGKPYLFINFGPWKSEIVKLAIWSEAIGLISPIPDENWVGSFVSVVGLMEPPYHSERFKYTHLSISITQNSQIKRITPEDARFRLGGASSQKTKPDNRQIMEKIGKPVSNRNASSSNQTILTKMKTVTGKPTTHRTKPSGTWFPQIQTQPGPQSRSQTKNASKSNEDKYGCIIVIIIIILLAIFL